MHTDLGRSIYSLLQRVRPAIEVAPWVYEELKRIAALCPNAPLHVHGTAPRPERPTLLAEEFRGDVAAMEHALVEAREARAELALRLTEQGMSAAVLPHDPTRAGWDAVLNLLLSAYSLTGAPDRDFLLSLLRSLRGGPRSALDQLMLKSAIGEQLDEKQQQAPRKPTAPPSPDTPCPPFSPL